MEKELFLEYEKLKREYNDANYEYGKAREQKERNELLMKSIKASNPSSELIKGSSNDKILNILAWNEELDNTILKKTKEIEDLDSKLKSKEYELRQISYKVLNLEKEQQPSKSDILNTIYLLKFIERYKVKYIGIKLHYSKTQTYRYLDEIRKKINMGKNGNFIVL